MRGTCDQGRRHLRTVPELDRLELPRAPEMLSIYTVPDVVISLFGHGVTFGQRDPERPLIRIQQANLNTAGCWESGTSELWNPPVAILPNF